MHEQTSIPQTSLSAQEVKNLNKVYTPPAILHELELETRAGSPLGVGDGVDPLGLNEPFTLP
jgi:hypothetical protein